MTNKEALNQCYGHLMRLLSSIKDALRAAAKVAKERRELVNRSKKESAPTFKKSA